MTSIGGDYMGKVIVVTSGKGGVGKTTSTAALGAALARSGQNVVVVDFDVGLRNLDLVMGAERRVVFDLINVVQGTAKLTQALIRDKRLETLYLLPASQTRDKDALTEEGVEPVIAELRMRFDWVLCDSPAGIERGATLAMRFADEAVIVTNPEVSSVRDSDRIIGLLDSKTVRAEAGERIDKHLLITRFDPARAARGEMLSIEDFSKSCRSRCSASFRKAKRCCGPPISARPITICGRESVPSRAYFSAARRLSGEVVDIIYPGQQKRAVRQTIRTESRMRKLFGFFRPISSAPVARERLQILLEYERRLVSQSSLITVLREEILAVVSRHVTVDPDKVHVSVDRGEGFSTLAVDIQIPQGERREGVRQVVAR